jgi:hypothetical protein
VSQSQRSSRTSWKPHANAPGFGCQRGSRGRAPTFTAVALARLPSESARPRIGMDNYPRGKSGRTELTRVISTRSTYSREPTTLVTVRATSRRGSFRGFTQSPVRERAGIGCAPLRAMSATGARSPSPFASPRKAYRVRAVSLFQEELDIADRLTRILQIAGWPRANRSFIVREALRRLDEDLAGMTSDEIFRYFVERHASRAKGDASETLV